MNMGGRKEEAKADRSRLSLLWKASVVCVILLLLAVSCTAQTAEPVEPTAEPSPTQDSALAIAPTAEEENSGVLEATKTYENQEAIRRVAIIDAADNRWEYSDLDHYLREYGTGWGQGVEGLVEQLDKKGWESPFRYFFIKDNRSESGYISSVSAYQATPLRLDVENSPNPNPSMLDERWVSNIVESIYIDLWVWYGDKREGVWEQIPDKYTTFIYMSIEIDSAGNEYDAMFLNLGGFFDIDEDGNFEYISLEEAREREFCEEVLHLIEQGYTMFVHTEDGRVIGRSNFNKFQENVLLASQVE